MTTNMKLLLAAGAGLVVFLLWRRKSAAASPASSPASSGWNPFSGSNPGPWAADTETTSPSLIASAGGSPSESDVPIVGSSTKRAPDSITNDPRWGFNSAFGSSPAAGESPTPQYQDGLLSDLGG